MKASLPSAAASRLRRNGWGEQPSKLERLLHLLGADPEFVDAVLGDLAEEHAARAKADGARAARWWYGRELLRSAPHLVASAVRVASWRRRAVLMMFLAAVALVVTFAAMSMLSGSDVPARLVASGDRGDGIVVNNERPVQLGMRVLDSLGRVMPDTGIRYRWLSGTPIPVTSRGVATCTQRGDAVVGASLGGLSTQLVLRCRPVHKVHAQWMANLIVGDSAVGVPFTAFDAQGRTVSLLRGELSVEDSSVATLDVAADGTRSVRARAPGTTMIQIRIGDRSAGMGVHVYERASSPEGIRPGQHLATRVELAGGDVRQWHLPAGRELYEVTMLPAGDRMHVPRLAIVGANCVTWADPHGFLCVALHGASVFVFHSRDGDQTRIERGTLAVWRHAKP
jgi:hypothetical protein